MSRMCATAAAMALCAGLAGPARAHHSPAAYDLDDLKTVAGIVKVFTWASPHSSILLVVGDGQGKTFEWHMELGAPFYLERSGWKKNSLHNGDKVTLTYAPLRTGGDGGLVMLARRANGKLIGQPLAEPNAKLKVRPGGVPADAGLPSPGGFSGGPPPPSQ